MRAKVTTDTNRRAAGEKEDGSAYKVLVADASLFATTQISQILNSEGFEVAARAADGEEAVNRYKELHLSIDLVLLDITMPKMDGITALEKIMEFDSKARVVMVAEIGAQDAVKKSLLAGAKNYIVKPLDRHKVLERIKSVLG